MHCFSRTQADPTDSKPVNLLVPMKLWNCRKIWMRKKMWGTNSVWSYMDENVIRNHLHKAWSVQVSDKHWYPRVSTNKLSNLHTTPLTLTPCSRGLNCQSAQETHVTRDIRCTASVGRRRSLWKENLRLRSTKSMWTMLATELLDWNFTFNQCAWESNPRWGPRDSKDSLLRSKREHEGGKWILFRLLNQEGSQAALMSANLGSFLAYQCLRLLSLLWAKAGAFRPNACSLGIVAVLQTACRHAKWQPISTTLCAHAGLITAVNSFLWGAGQMPGMFCSYIHCRRTHRWHDTRVFAATEGCEVHCKHEATQQTVAS